MANQRASSSPRLSVDDWLHAGFTTLAEDGIEGLRIEKLTTCLGVTKGSFYWHFADIDAYRNALITAWGDGLADDHQKMTALGDASPRERLAAMMTILVRPQHWALELSMREWARSNHAAAQSVRASDRRVLNLVRQVFVDAGFDSQTAQTRAEWIFAIGIGYLSLARSGPHLASAARRAELVDFMLQQTEV